MTDIDQTHMKFRRIQSDDLTTLTVFASQDGTLADGTTVEGPLESVTLTLTPLENAQLVSMVARARQDAADSVNIKRRR